MKTKEKIFEEIKPMIVDIFVVEPEEVVPSARFFVDLGAESIDMLDLSFHCEKHFGIKLDISNKLLPDDIETDSTGRLTTESLLTVKKRLPFLDYSEFEKEPTKNRMRELITVDAIVNLVHDALKSKKADGEPAEVRTAPGFDAA